VGSARRRLEQGSVNIAQVLDLEDLAGWVGTILGEGAGEGDAVGLEVLA